MQDMVGGDNNRTSLVFQAPDIYIIVGVITVDPFFTGCRVSPLFATHR